MKLTAEMQAIVKASKELASQGGQLVVNAFAGAGKTSNLVEVANANSDKSILALSFNVSVRDEAARRYPRNAKRQGQVFQVAGPLACWLLAARPLESPL